MVSSYPSIYNLGHAAVATLLNGPVIVEEKIDGSQISFRRNAEGELEVRSKGAAINIFAPEGMFKKAVEYLLSIKDQIPMGDPNFSPRLGGPTFRGEFLSKPKHNVLAYAREPQNNIIIFDVEVGEQAFASPAEKIELARSIGLETVPQLFVGNIENPEQIRAFLEQESVLGGQKIEGVVVKPLAYDAFGRDKKVLMGKFVSEQFKETHAATWKQEHGPKSGGDILRELAMDYSSPARWQKALIHLREDGAITDSLQDIGVLMKVVPMDVEKECKEEILDALWKWAWPTLRRAVSRGLPEWYKDVLLKKQFESEPAPQTADTDPSSPYANLECSRAISAAENEGMPGLLK